MAKAAKPERTLPHGPKQKKAAKKRTRKGLKNRTENMTPKRWQEILAAIANGANRKEACHEAGISHRTLAAYLVSNVAATQQLRDAELIWIRKDWSYDEIERICVELSLGKTVKQAAMDCEVELDRLPSLYRLLLKDKSTRQMYDEARELGAEAMADDIIDISDETMYDTKTNKSGDEVFNHEAINRSRLRVDTRKWLMGKHVAKRFGDTKHHLHEGDISVNHAAVLTGGRKRLENLHSKRSGKKKDEPVVIEHDDQGNVVIDG